MIQKLRAWPEWKFLGVLPRANRPLALAWWLILAMRGVLPALFAIVEIQDYDPQWPELFQREAERICNALGPRALRVEHAGSTSVPGLAAKPVIDIVLEVADSADEAAYAGDLERAGYVLRIREPEWYEHRMFKGQDVNLHVFSAACPEIERMLLFRDWLRGNAADRDLYARAKLALARQQWNCVQDYADAKTTVVREILERAGRNRK